MCSSGRSIADQHRQMVLLNANISISISGRDSSNLHDILTQTMQRKEKALLIQPQSHAKQISWRNTTHARLEGELHWLQTYEFCEFPNRQVRETLAIDDVLERNYSQRKSHLQWLQRKKRRNYTALLQCRVASTS